MHVPTQKLFKENYIILYNIIIVGKFGREQFSESPMIGQTTTIQIS